MNNKVLIGALSVFLILGGAAAVGASKYITPADDTVHQEDKIINKEARTKAELETEHGQTFNKMEYDESSSLQQMKDKLISREDAAEIARQTVNGTVKQTEQEQQHGRIEYKVELDTKNGEAEVRIDAKTGKVVRVEYDDTNDDGEHHQ